MKVLSCLSAITALLGACTSTAVPPPGTASWDNLTHDYTVIQDGVTHTLSGAAPSSLVTYNGLSLRHWPSSGATPSGYAPTILINADAAAGLDNGVYFAGISGSLNAPTQTTGTATYRGAYGFVVNGADHHGPLALTANFTTGTLVDTSTGIDVNATISGANIDGTVTIGGETGTLKGGFYDSYSDMLGVAIGARMAGVISAY